MTKYILHSKPLYDLDDYQGLESCLDNHYTASNGRNSIKLKEALIKFYNTKDVELTSSGSTAILIALISLGLKPNNKVLLTTYLCPEVYDSVKFLNLIPVLIDIDVNTFTMSVDNLTLFLEKNKIDAIIFPHLFGISGEIEKVMKLGIPVIEDISQGVGAQVNYKPVGSIGDISIMSFKSIKMLGGGEGGAVLFNNPKYLEKFHEFENGYNTHYGAFKFPMSEISAALSYTQFSKLHIFMKQRQQIYDIYNKEFISLQKASVFAFKNSDAKYRYLLKLNQKNIDAIIKDFEKNGILVRKPVDTLLHKKYSIEGNFENAENAFDSIISIPIYPALEQHEIEKIILTVKKILR